MDEGEVHHKV